VATTLGERLRETRYDRLGEQERAELIGLCERELERAKEWKREQDSRDPSDAYLTHAVGGEFHGVALPHGPDHPARTARVWP